MKKLFLLSSILLLSACWAVAQDVNTPHSTGQSSNAADTTTVQGCLSMDDGMYTLSDPTGTAYRLTGDTSKLQAHVGHTIQVTGTVYDPNLAKMQGGAMSAPADSHATLNVNSFKHIAASCKVAN
jgi:hypothetical protein